MRPKLLFLLVTLPSILTGCGSILGDGCGLFGATTSYSDEFVMDQTFEPITVVKGETYTLLPGEPVYIDYTYTGSSNCEGEDYRYYPQDFHPRVEHDSIATITVYFDYNAAEQAINITGKEAGTTTLRLKVEWSVDTRDELIFKDSTLAIGLTVTES